MSSIYDWDCVEPVALVLSFLMLLLLVIILFVMITVGVVGGARELVRSSTTEDLRFCAIASVSFLAVCRVVL